MGFISGKSKFLAFFVIYILMMVVVLFDVVGRLPKKKWILVALIGLVLVLIAVFPKLNFYFIDGFDAFSGMKDGKVVDYNSFMLARPALYDTGVRILYDYFPFGSGLGSFGTYASAEYCSSVYSDYGIGRIYGLSKESPGFICDAFFPSLAQYGVFGILLFFLFWKNIWSELKPIGCRFSKNEVVGILLLTFLLIESSTDTTLTQNRGGFVMLLLALIIIDKRFDKTAENCERS